MLRLGHILVGIDLRQGDRLASGELEAASQAALEQAIELALVNQARLTLLSVLDLSPFTAQLIVRDKENVLRTVEDVAMTKLLQLVNTAKSRGVNASSRLRIGHPSDELLAEVHQLKPDLVVVGAREKGATARFFFGGTSQTLIRHCPYPVWISKPGEVRELREVLVASDLTDASSPAIRTGVTIAQALNAKLYVVHATEYALDAYLRTAGVDEEEIRRISEQRQTSARDTIAKQLSDADARTLQQPVQVDILGGDPDHIIEEYAAEKKIDVVVVGTHARSGLSGLLLGNTSDRLLNSLHASLVVVRIPDAPAA